MNTQDNSADDKTNPEEYMPPTDGWYTFGFHADLNPVPELEFLGVGEDFYPLWERPRVTNTATLYDAILNR